MERAYLNEEEGFACCCWQAPSVGELEELFRSSETPYEQMREVREMTG